MVVYVNPNSTVPKAAHNKVNDSKIPISSLYGDYGGDGGEDSAC